VAELIGGSTVHYGPLGGQPMQPMVVTHQHGRGRVAYFAMPIGARYLELGIGDHRSMIEAAVRWSGGEPPIRLSGAPSTVAMTAFRQASCTLIHLVDSVRDEIMRPITEIAECRGATIELDVATEPSTIVAVGQSVELSWSFESGRLSVALGPFCHHVLIVVGHGPSAMPRA